jgi:hypothetical protein
MHRAPQKVGVAERVGFEPTVRLPGQRFSRPPDSAALAPLRSKTLFVIRYLREDEGRIAFNNLTFSE